MRDANRAQAQTRTTAAAGAPPELLDSAGVAALLGVNRQTVERWRMNGEGPPYIVVGPRIVRYDLAEVTGWLETRRRRSTSDSGEAA